MERIQGEFNRKETNIFSDSTHRMSGRPFSVQSGKGRGHEDLGSSFARGPGPSRPAQGKATGSKVKSATSRPIMTSLERDSFSDSDDELLLSEGAQLLGSSPVQKRVVRGKTAASMPQKANLAPNGHQYHPQFPPKAKFPKFTRIKKESQADESSPEGPPSSSLHDADDSQELFRPISDDLTSQPAAKPKKEKDTDFVRPGPGKNSASRRAATPSSTLEDEPLKPVTKPRPVKAGSSIARGQSPEATPRAGRQLQPFPLGSHSSVHGGSSRASDVSPPRKGARERSAAKKENTNALLRKAAAPFPMRFQSEEKTSALPRKHTAPSLMIPLGKSNLPAKQPLLEPTGPKPFPSSLQTSKPGLARSETLGNFPTPSPLASPVQPLSRDKGKGLALTPHQDEDDLGGFAIDHRDTVRTDVALRPFPLSSREIKIAHRRSPMRSKRVSDGSDEQRGPKAKRHKEDNYGKSARLILGEEEHLDEDSFEIDTVVDPSTVCPYCDEPLPRNPTPQLKNLLAIAKRKSYADPRPRNSRGLKAPLGIYISACQRHHFEMHSLPEAMEKGWPQSIDFKKVPKRVEGMKSALEVIITNADSLSDNEDSVENNARGSRARSDFWEEIKKQIKKQGSRAVTGVKGQFASFEKTQPGYYGELGLLIIHQTLYNLFPFSSFDASSIAPLTPAEFIQLVLVPEAAVGLIMQDLHLDRDEAIVTLRESSQYGVAMFPDTGSGKGTALGADDDDDEGVADRIVMERAKARRLELEEEEKIEEQMWKEERAKRRSAAQMERKEKAHQRAKQLKKSKELTGYTSCEVSEASESEIQSRPVRNTSKVGSRTTTDSETDNMSVDSSTSRRSTRSRTGAGMMCRTTSAKSVSSNMQISDDSAVEIVEEKEQLQVRRSSRHATPSVNDIGQHSDAVSSSSITRTRRLKNFKSDDRDTDVDIGDVPLKPVLEIDEESTPRPHRSKVPIVPTLGLPGATTSIRFPLQVARSRSVTSTTSDGWRKTLIPGASDAEDSDDSQAVQQSRDTYNWLLSPSSSTSSR
ncbi:RTC4-like domain-containing protein [Suillus clintonianus]|uniref:RTC4-like domain-containing protein n=1 Tax=Suillus clintonianus TaxID=1904413 RepID=UPI001B871808|nr:RTC4-like domain-containing protein [Suillus clintonianus]KAG2144598.1 RTC4-like domain-containing protein [Suillus clintonianus]